MLRLAFLRPLARGLVALAIGLALFAFSPWSERVLAQSIPPGDLQRLLQRGAGDDNDTDPTPSNKPVVQTYQPAQLPAEAPASNLETLFSNRAGRPMHQVGYGTFGTPASVSVMQTGALQDSFIIGTGDEVVVVFRGQENATYRSRVGTDGTIVFPKLQPILAGGRSLGEVRRQLERAVAQSYISTNVYVSIGNIHQLSVMVTGNVRIPGVRVVSALASPMDAILLSGGISKAGSLRSIQLIRDGQAHIIDLYTVIFGGSPANLGMLRDGDRIFVPGLGPTVGIAGGVHRGGIFELPHGARAISVEGLIRLGAGPEIAGAFDLSKAELESDGATRLIPMGRNGSVRPGEILFLDMHTTAALNRVQLLGAVPIEGARPYTNAHTLGELISNTRLLLADAYTLFAVVARKNPTSNAVTLIPVSLKQIIDKTRIFPLLNDDTVYVFHVNEIRALTSLTTANINVPFQANLLGRANGRGNNGNGNGNGNGQGAGAGSNNTGDAAGTAAAGSAAAASAVAGGTQFAGDNSVPPGGTPGSWNGMPGGGAPGSDNAAFAGSNLGAVSDGGESDPRLRGASDRSNSLGASAIRQSEAVTRRSLTNLGQEPITAPTDEETVRSIAQQLSVAPSALVGIAMNNLAWVLDEVQVPGAYLAAPGTPVWDLLEAAGGVTQRADLSAVEVTSTVIDQKTGYFETKRNSFNGADASLQEVSIATRDVIRVRPVYTDRADGTVTVVGEVRYPGVFDITRDERLSSVLLRAGGMTEVSFPYGAIFTRRAAALSEREGNERTAVAIERQIATVAAAATANTSQVQADVAYLSTLAQQFRNAPVLGRITVTADPTVLATKPELDLVLEPGDTIFVPKRPSSVTVSGEILNPGTLQYRSNLGATDYIRLAGGVTADSDDGRTFIVLPDGSAHSLSDGWVQFGSSGFVPPGSTIVVPRNLRPFSWAQFLKDATQVISQLAVTAASLSVIQRSP